MTDLSSTRKSARRSAFARLTSEHAVRMARLWSGLVMMTFVVMHLGNLALNLISLDAAEAARLWFLLFWRNPLGTVVLYGAVLVHVMLVLRALYLRRTLAMPAREMAQTLLGLAIPLLLAEHVLGTRVFHELTGIHDTYKFVVGALWIFTPWVGARQAFALLVVWGHGCLGVHFWLRFRPWYPRAAPWLLIAAVLIPVLALLGFSDAGRTLSAAGGPLFPAEIDPALIDYGIGWKNTLALSIYLGFGFIVAAVLALRALRQRRECRDLVEIRYDSGQIVRVPKGSTVLEASRIGGVPHHSVCGGKGRCSTCRVRVIDGLGDLPPPGQVERTMLKRISAQPDVRLACQLKPTHNLLVSPLLAAGQDHLLPARSRSSTPGREQEIAVLFCDMRSFTAMSDRRLPYDIVFLLNRYFAVVGKAVEQSGGRLDKFIGDGAMALFGLNSSKLDACRQALSASAAIIKDLNHLSDELASEIPGPLRVAIGIHVGPAIVGAMGYGGVMGMTAIGDAVNVASRLESAAKEFNAAIVISEDAAMLSGIDMSRFEMRKIAIRGSAAPLNVRVVPQGAAFLVQPVDGLAEATVTG